MGSNWSVTGSSLWVRRGVAPAAVPGDVRLRLGEAQAWAGPELDPYWAVRRDGRGRVCCCAHPVARCPIKRLVVGCWLLSEVGGRGVGVVCGGPKLALWACGGMWAGEGEWGTHPYVRVSVRSSACWGWS
eukprot:3390960-Amphidinium_carterae.1